MARRIPAQYDWAKLEFDQTLLTKHFTVQSSKAVRYVVVHHMTIVGNGSGSALDACYRVWQNRQASAHYGVDGTLVRQYVWDKDYAWATGSTAGNRYGISIEHANSSAGPKWYVSETTWKTGAHLAAQLHKTYKLGRPVKDKTLRKHSSFTATACPGPYLGGTAWSTYAAEAQRVYDEITGTNQSSKEKDWLSMATEAEIFNAVWETRVSPASPKDPAFPDDHQSAKWTLVWAAREATKAARDAAATLALTKVLVERGTALTAAEIEAAVKAGIDAKIDTATVNLNANE